MVITAKDYVDLTENLSEKNIINTISGKEYVVTAIKDTVLHSKKYEPNTLDRIFNTDGTPKYVKELEVNSQTKTFKVLGIFQVEKVYARSEAVYYYGGYEFEVDDKVIEDMNSLSCSVQINYTKSKVKPLNETNWNLEKRTAFFNNVSDFVPVINEGTGETQVFTTTEFIPSSDGYDNVVWLIDRGGAKADAPAVFEYIRPKVIAKTSSKTRIEVDFVLKIWTAWNEENEGSETAYCVKDFTINTTANTVSTEQVEFGYTSKGANVERGYTLETNELFQTTLMSFQVENVDSTTEGTYYVLNEQGEYEEVELPSGYVAGKTYYSYKETPKEEKLSYYTFNNIVNKYKKDRRIISFDLLNPIKETFDDSKVYTNGLAQERYLDVNDIFEIYDVDKNYMGKFRVIQSNPIWKGFYHKRITAILVE